MKLTKYSLFLLTLICLSLCSVQAKFKGRSLSRNMLSFYYDNLIGQECGLVKTRVKQIQTSKRIIGGSNAEEGQMPWIAILGYRKTELIDYEVDYTFVVCGGTLITDRFVLTAGHCVDIIEPVEVKLGAHNHVEGENSRIYAVQNVKLHEEFNKEAKINDIALIKLKEHVEFTDYIQPACLPFKKYWSMTYAEATAVVAGWGYTVQGSNPEESTILQVLPVRVWTPKECLAESRYSGTIKSEQHMCAGGDQGLDSCNGDSGGPLVWKNHASRYYLIGIVSYGTDECGIGSPGVYTRVTNYLRWIVRNMALRI